MTDVSSYVAATVLLVSIMLGIATYVLFYYVRTNWRSIEIWVLVTIGFSFWVCICPPALLLVDIDASTAKVDLPWMASLWMTVFWITQVLSWAVLPIIQEYVGSGEFTAKKKFIHSIQLNTKLYLILGVIGVVLLIYVWFAKGLHSINQLVSLVIAASNAFGLALIIMFLAHGMAAIPKQIWRRSDARLSLEFEYWKCPALHDDLECARIEWTETCASVRKISTKFDKSSAFYPCVDQILTTVNEFEGGEFGGLGTGGRNTSIPFELNTDNDDALRSGLVRLHAQVKKCIHEVTRLESQWKAVALKCEELELMCQRHKLSIARKWFFRATAVACGVISVLVAWSEFTLPFHAKELGEIDLSVISILMVGHGGARIAWCAVVLFFMALMTYWSVFQFKLFHFYALTRHHSDPASLCFTAVFLTRLIMPLCYNFLNIAHMTQGNSNVTYSRLFGDMDVVDFLGPWFNRCFPMLVLVLYVCFITNVFSRFFSMCGITTFDVRSVEDDKVSEGKELIARGRRNAELDVFRQSPHTVDRDEDDLQRPMTPPTQRRVVPIPPISAIKGKAY
jgi:hypothetical protein